MKCLLIIMVLISSTVDADTNTLDSKELNCLVRNAFFEANLEGNIGMLLVTNVVFNRTQDRNVCATIFAKNQFSWTSGVKTKKIPVNIYNDIKSTIAKFSKHRRFIPRKFINATHYHAQSEHPAWASRLKKLGVYKNHIFYQEG